MSRQAKTRRSGRNIEIGRRELWLAGLGAVSLTRKQALATFEAVNAGSLKFREQARTDLATWIEQAGEQAEALRKQAGTALRQVQARVSPVRQRAEAALAEGRQLLEPLLVKLGVSAKKKSAVRRKPAARKAPARKVAHRAA
jgi:hypothetical protein